MKLSFKSDYACRAVQALALHHPNTRPLRIEEISKRESIPSAYLVQILIELKSKGIIQSRRGKAGGYNLAKPPAAITVGDVVRAVHGEVLEIPPSTGTRGADEIKRVWQRIQAAADEVVNSVTFEQLCAEAQLRGNMYYI